VSNYATLLARRVAFFRSERRFRMLPAPIISRKMFLMSRKLLATPSGLNLARPPVSAMPTGPSRFRRTGTNRQPTQLEVARSRPIRCASPRPARPRSRSRSQRLKQRRAAGNRPFTILRRRGLRRGSGEQRSRDEATACQLVPRVPGVPRIHDRLEQFARRQVSEVTRSQGWRQVGRGDGAHTPYLSGRS
jgi:hypothetical protein